MKKSSKNNREKARQKALQAKSRKMKMTVGIDLGDEWSHCCFLGEEGEIVEECRVKTTREAYGYRRTGKWIRDSVNYLTEAAPSYRTAVR